MTIPKRAPRVLLWSGDATLTSGEITKDLTCRVYRGHIGQSDPVIECRARGGDYFGFVSAKSLQLQLPGYVPQNVILTSSNMKSSGRFSLTLMLTRSPWLKADGNRFSHGRNLILNFAPYWMGNPHKFSFDLIADGWQLKFIAINERMLASRENLSGSEIQVTHQLEFARENGSSFTKQDVEEMIAKLIVFLSFCRGRWVGYSRLVAFDAADGTVQLELWGSSRFSTWRTPSSWLDEQHGESILLLCEPFFAILQQTAWRETIGIVVYWSARADVSNAGSDGGCILLQAALERLAWHVLVRERMALSEKGFRDLSAADQMRLLLNILSIPTAIPETLPALKKLGKSKSMDGPEVFTYVRNRIVHPPKVSAHTQELPFYQAHCLGRQYLDLIILALCRYTGDYSNCTKMPRWTGEVEKVPWA